MSNDCTGFSQWKMDIWLNLMHEKLDCRPEGWWYSNHLKTMTELPCLKYRDQHSALPIEHRHWRSEASSSLGVIFFSSPSSQERDIPNVLGIPALRDDMRGWLWDADARAFPLRLLGFFPVSKHKFHLWWILPMPENFCACFVAILVGKKKQFITKPAGDFSCCGHHFPGRFPYQF